MREMNIGVLDVDGFQTCFGSVASAIEIFELTYIHYTLKENFSATLTQKGFTCVSLICRELSRTKTMTDLKSGSNKTAATL